MGVWSVEQLSPDAASSAVLMIDRKIGLLQN